MVWRPTCRTPSPKQPVEPLTEEKVNELLAGRGLRGWLRAARVARVLGLFSLYLFLDTYDVRADFNRRAVARLRDLARQKGRAARIQCMVQRATLCRAGSVHSRVTLRDLSRR